MNPESLDVLKVEYLITRRCNLDCGYCKITDQSSLRGKELNTAQAKGVLDQVASYWPTAPVILFGGEPTVRDDLPDVLKYGIDLGLKLAVISNSDRVLNDIEFRDRLVASGLDNWSVSYDGSWAGDSDTRTKSKLGLRALRMFRKEYGFKDLVACITVSRSNINELPAIVNFLSTEGVWSICTPIQRGGRDYDYSCGGSWNMPSAHQIAVTSAELSKMASSGNYLMHNDPSWFDLWPGYFLQQNWRCSTKSILTVDADGSLRRCVDQPLSKPISIFDLSLQAGNEYPALVAEGAPERCGGCFWDPAYESIMRAQNPELSLEEGRRFYRHELSDEQLSRLIPDAGKWFRQ